MDILSPLGYLEMGLFIILIACVFYMYGINKKLKAMRNGGDGFKAVIIELNHAVDNAQKTVHALKLTVRDAENGLAGNLKQARNMSDELKYLVERASMYNEDLNSKNIMGSNQIMQNKPAEQGTQVAQNRPKNFADQTLERVNKQRQNLPNPILQASSKSQSNYNADNDPSLGQNLDLGHKQIALQRRDEALKAIAEKQLIVPENSYAGGFEEGELQQRNRQNSRVEQPRASQPRVRQVRPKTSHNTDFAEEVGQAERLNLQAQNDLGENIEPNSLVTRDRNVPTGSFDRSASLSDMIEQHVAKQRYEFGDNKNIQNEQNMQNMQNMQNEPNTQLDVEAIADTGLSKRQKLMNKLSSTR